MKFLFLKISENFDLIYSKNIFFSILQINTFINEKNSTIDVEYVKYIHSVSYQPWENITDLAVTMDNVEILRLVLSKQLPAERYNGLINLFYIFENPNATLTEITSALVKRRTEIAEIFTQT